MPVIDSTSAEWKREAQQFLLYKQNEEQSVPAQMLRRDTVNGYENVKQVRMYASMEALFRTMPVSYSKPFIAMLERLRDASLRVEGKARIEAVKAIGVQASLDEKKKGKFS